MPVDPPSGASPERQIGTLIGRQLFQNNGGNLLIRRQAWQQDTAQAQYDSLQLLDGLVEDGFQRQGRDVTKIPAKTL